MRGEGGKEEGRGRESEGRKGREEGSKGREEGRWKRERRGGEGRWRGRWRGRGGRREGVATYNLQSINRPWVAGPTHRGEYQSLLTQWCIHG